MSIENADLPAMPQDRGIWVDGIGDCPTLATGLTKREYAAIELAKGIISNPSLFDVLNQPESLAKYATTHADALLAELEKQP